ncbi:MAG: phosphopantetheine-binding protein, partial [Nostoc sp.]
MLTFPLNLNGKIDRKSLPEISLSVLQGEDAYVAPTTEIEKTIAEIWQDLLDVDRISLYDDFFVLGGNSLLVIRLKFRIEQSLGINLPMKMFY